jgi:two-component system, LytTR family, response regulator
MSFTYVIVDNSKEEALQTKGIADDFPELVFLGMANTHLKGIDLVLEKRPQIVFLEIDSTDKKNLLSLAFISELHRFLTILPKIIITTNKKEWAFDAINYGVFDYYTKPVDALQMVKTIHKLNKKEAFPSMNLHNPTGELAERMTIETTVGQKPLIICIKSYGDYRYINADDICYFQADNNSTDIHLNSGEMITAFKTLKHFESVLDFPFIRIHNSYIVNRNYISRIQAGNSLCFIRNSLKKIPFSRSYKSNIELIIADFSRGNYLEI